MENFLFNDTSCRFIIFFSGFDLISTLQKLSYHVDSGKSPQFFQQQKNENNDGKNSSEDFTKIVLNVQF